MLSCRLGYFMKTGRLGAQGVAPKWIWKDGRPGGGAQVAVFWGFRFFVFLKFLITSKSKLIRVLRF